MTTHTTITTVMVTVIPMDIHHPMNIIPIPIPMLRRIPVLPILTITVHHMHIPVHLMTTVHLTITPQQNTTIIIMMDMIIITDIQQKRINCYHQNLRNGLR